MNFYTIISYDNGCFGDGGAPMNRGDYQSATEAIARAHELVDESLAEHFDTAKDAADLMIYFTIYGCEVPFIHGVPVIDFDPYVYARERATLMYSEKGSA